MPTNKTAAAKGKVTSLSSIFSAEESLRASIRVHEAIADRRRQLDSIRSFISDNDKLINLVHRLPDELHHHIMVPFGKAAFFPGRLVHTNEFLVFLGEGYYVDRTSKQTVDILKRRGEVLETQLDSLEAVMQDLEAEASFFESTATEAAEGLVEIREDYPDEESEESMSKAGFEKQDVPGVSGAIKSQSTVGDDEYARLMSRLDELEKEELAAESVEELEEMNLIESFHHNKEGDKVLKHSIQDKSAENVPTSQAQTSLRSILKSRDEVPNQLPKPDVAGQMSNPVSHSRKAFSGSIIERTSNLPNNPIQQSTAQPSGTQPSKPVSRFKMQRR